MGTDPAETVMAVIEPGEAISTGQTVKIRFAGRDHFVRACIGTSKGDCVLWLSQDNGTVDPVEVRQRFFRSACAIAIVNNPSAPGTILEKLAHELVDAFSHALAYLTENRPNRVKQ